MLIRVFRSKALRVRVASGANGHLLSGKMFDKGLGGDECNGLEETWREYLFTISRLPPCV